MSEHAGGPNRLAAHVPVRRQGQHHCAAPGQLGAGQGGAAELQGGHEQQQAGGHPALLLLNHSGPAVRAAAQRGQLASLLACLLGRAALCSRLGVPIANL